MDRGMDRTIKLLTALAVFAFITPAYAADDKKVEEKPAVEKAAEKDSLEPYVYTPEGCQFSVTFPSEPHKVERCEGEDGKKCYDLMTYTQTYDMAASVNFRVICNPIDKEIYSHYSAEIMEATLKAMTKNTIVKTYNTSFREEKNYKQAGLVGESEVGRSSTIYIAQLWIANGSALSMEAEMVGEQNEHADLLFSEVLKSVGYSGSNAEIKKEEKGEENDKDKAEDKAESKSEAKEEPAEEEPEEKSEN